MESKSSLLLLITHFLSTINWQNFVESEFRLNSMDSNKIWNSTQKNVLTKVHSKNPESESWESNSGTPKFVRDLCKNQSPSQMEKLFTSQLKIPKPAAYQQRRCKKEKGLQLQTENPAYS